MAENKVATQNRTGAFAGTDAVEVANMTAAKELSPADQAVQREYEAIVADIAREGDFLFPDREPVAESETASVLGEAEVLGKTLKDPALVARFEGVKENLEREVRGGMCTAEQAYAYLENIEISLLLEQEAAVKA